MFINKNFFIFFSALTIGSLGNWLDIFAIQIILVHEYHASPSVIGLLMMLCILPGIFLGPIAGVIADYFEKKVLLVVGELICATLTLAVIFSSGITYILTLIALRAIIVTLTMPTQQSAVRMLVKADELLAASSLVATVYQIMRIIGPFFGAFLLLYFQPKLCLYLNCFSFLMSALFISTITFPAYSLKKSIPLGKENLFRFLLNEFKEMWMLIKTTKAFHSSLSIILAYFFFIAIGETQVIIFLKGNVQNSETFFGYAMAINAVGAMLSAFMLTKVATINDYPLVILSSIFISGVGYLIFGIYKPIYSVLFLIIASLLQGLGFGALIAIYSYLIKSITDLKYVGRMSGVSMSIQGVILVFGFICSGPLVTLIGASETYMLLAIGALITIGISISFYLIPNSSNRSLR